jgi:hypothetical protein
MSASIDQLIDRIAADAHCEIQWRNPAEATTSWKCCIGSEKAALRLTLRMSAPTVGLIWKVIMESHFLVAAANIE